MQRGVAGAKGWLKAVLGRARSRRCGATRGSSGAAIAPRSGGWAAAWTRLARIATWSVRGVFVQQLSLQAAALAYYTLFSIVPVLVVALWALKLFHLIPYLKPRMPDAADARRRLPRREPFLRQAVRAILAAVDRAGRLETGIVGLAALLYGVIRQVHPCRGGAGHHRRRARPAAPIPPDARLPRVARAASGAARRLRPAAHAVPAAARVDVRARAVLAAGGGRRCSSRRSASPSAWRSLCLALAIFYASAARARIAFSSAIVGGALGAVLLAAVLWVFARLQIGVSRAGALESGMAAVPVFLLWAFSSWLVILIGAQVAVAHELDGILIHGARVPPLDPYDEQMAGVQIMVELARGARGAGDGSATTDELARRLRLLPESVRVVAGRLQRADCWPAPTTVLSARLRSRPDQLARRRGRAPRPP